MSEIGMRAHHIIHVSATAAFLAIASSVALTYAYPSIETAVAAPSETSADVFPASSTVIIVDNKGTTSTQLGLPLSHALDRVTKKTFGMEIHPATSPVPNDKFDGFHVGVDFETTEAEADIDVPVSVICDGALISKGYAKGYGGYALQACKLDEKDVVVLYGHLHLETIEPKAKQELKRGDQLGMLGKGHSTETDGVRKHLHLGVHRGSEIDIRGYVPETTEIGGWLDPLPYMKP